jgi:hypothetical protein
VSLQGFYVAALLAALVQYLRLRDARLLPLLAMFALLAVAPTRTTGTRRAPGTSRRAPRAWCCSSSWAGVP